MLLCCSELLLAGPGSKRFDTHGHADGDAIKVVCSPLKPVGVRCLVLRKVVPEPEEPCPVPPPARWDTSPVIARVFAEIGPDSPFSLPRFPFLSVTCCPAPAIARALLTLHIVLMLGCATEESQGEAGERGRGGKESDVGVRASKERSTGERRETERGGSRAKKEREAKTAVGSDRGEARSRRERRRAGAKEKVCKDKTPAGLREEAEMSEEEGSDGRFVKVSITGQDGEDVSAEDDMDDD